QVLEHAINLQRARPGDLIKIPYEVTVASGLRDFWQASFYSHDRITTSTPFARSLGLQDQVLPFNLMLFLASSMSHAEAAVVQVAYCNAKYLWPGFAGDTFTKTFEIKRIRNTSGGESSTFDFTCRLVNQRGKTCLQCDKTMMFPFFAPPSAGDGLESTREARDGGEAGEAAMVDSLRDHLIKQAEKLGKGMGGVL
ncbi:unnamed protein product, partial [Discosporangium mesarthrocarpum]